MGSVIPEPFMMNQINAHKCEKRLSFDGLFSFKTLKIYNHFQPPPKLL